MRTCLRMNLLFAAVVLSLCLSMPSDTPAQAPAPPPSKKPAMGPPAPQSTHYPILILAFGTNPSWSLRIGQKGPERLVRPNYPPIPLEAAEVTHEAADSWIYRAKDSATGAPVAIHLSREACLEEAAASPAAPPSPAVKFTFTASVDHAQLGNLKGCARIAPELFPKINNQPDADDDDADKKKPPPPTITNFKSPVAIAFLNPPGNVTVSRGGVRKAAAAAGSELALSHDGKKLLYTRSDSKTGPERTIVLYDFDTGASKNLVSGLVRQAFWSPDDSHIAFLKAQDHDWHVWTCTPAAPEAAAAFSTQAVTSLHGWADNHSLLASDLQNAYWLSEDRPPEAHALKDLYGETFQIVSSDTIRINPVNSDLLLVSAYYAASPSGAPKDAIGLTSSFFLYEVRSKRRVILCPADQWARGAEWSRDGLQIFYSRITPATGPATFRIFWDGTGGQKYAAGTSLVVGQ